MQVYATPFGTEYAYYNGTVFINPKNGESRKTTMTRVEYLEMIEKGLLTFSRHIKEPLAIEPNTMLVRIPEHEEINNRFLSHGKIYKAFNVGRRSWGWCANIYNDDGMMNVILGTNCAHLRNGSWEVVTCSDEMNPFLIGS